MPKRFFSLVVSLCVRAWDALVDVLCKLIGIKRPARCIVLAYHSVSEQERPYFAEQMDIVLKLAEVVPADVKSLPTPDKRYAAITFDDGLENTLDNALPELLKRNIPVTFFIVADRLGQNRSWEHLGGDDTRAQRVMSEVQLLQLPRDLVTIGSHTMTHPLLVSAEKDRVRQEVTDSRIKLERMLNREVTTFSFPYGAFNQDAIDLCREAGYRRLFTALPLFAVTRPNEFVTGRVGTTPLDWPIEFRLKLAGSYRWLPYVFAFKRLVLSTVSRRSKKRMFELNVREKSLP